MLINARARGCHWFKDSPAPQKRPHASLARKYTSLPRRRRQKNRIDCNDEYKNKRTNSKSNMQELRLPSRPRAFELLDRGNYKDSFNFYFFRANLWRRYQLRAPSVERWFFIFQPVQQQQRQIQRNLCHLVVILVVSSGNCFISRFLYCGTDSTNALILHKKQKQFQLESSSLRSRRGAR